MTPAFADPADLAALRDLLPARVRVFACASTHDVLAAAAAASAGTALAVVPSHLFAAAARVLDVGIAPAAQRASAHDPLVALRIRSAAALQGLPGALLVEGPGAVSPGAAIQPLAALDTGEVVAARMVRGLGSVILVAGSLPEGFLGAGGEEFLRALLAHPAPATPSAQAHPPVPVVHAGPWDLSLLPAATVPVADPAFCRAVAHAQRLLPPDVHDALVDFADDPGPSGALLLRGVPVGAPPATPPHPMQAAKTDAVSEFALLTAARRLGQPVGYLPEHGGDLVQNVVPVRSTATAQVSTSSGVVLELHTEAAFHPFRPRYLLLLALRGDPQAATTLCSASALLPQLSAQERSVLSEPRFTTGIDASYAAGSSGARSLPRPVLWGSPARPRLWLDNDLMRGTDPQAQRALGRIAQLARESAASVVLQSGDLLVVDNDMAVHGRGPFSPRYDGTDRWLQRSMVVADLGAAAADLRGRIVATQFVS